MNQTKGQTLSAKQFEFLQKEKKQRNKIYILRLMLLALFIIMWEHASKYKLIDSFFFGSPTGVIKCFAFSIKNSHLLLHIGISLYETLLSFVIIMGLSIIIASILWRFSFFSKCIEPLLVLLNSLPKSALAPLFIVWLGTGFKTIVVAGVSVAIFGCIINLYTCFLNTDPEKQKLITLLGGKKRHIFFMVILPNAFETILSNMKVNIGLSLVGVMIGEFLAARRGLGYLILYASQIFKLDLLITCIIILCVISVVFYECINYLEKKITH